MDSYILSRESAVKHLKVADHILTQTYRLVKDTKLLLVVVENLYKSCDGAVSAILEFERKYKKIPPYHESFADKVRVFEARNRRRYFMKNEYVQLMKDLAKLVRDHIKAPVEFARKGKYVLADEEFKLSQVTEDDMKTKLELAKLFIQDMGLWMDKHERSIR